MPGSCHMHVLLRSYLAAHIYAFPQRSIKRTLKNKKTKNQKTTHEVNSPVFSVLLLYFRFRFKSLVQPKLKKNCKIQSPISCVTFPS